MHRPDTDSAPTRDVIHTACGREIVVSRLQLRGLGRSASRVTLNTGRQPHDLSEVWASLTAAEARQLAGRLLAQAEATERTADNQVTSTNAAPERGRGEGEHTEDHSNRVDVAHVSGESYSITVRGHEVLVDQPTRHGGTDAAPTPTELFVASLASCVAFYAGRYLARHGVSRDSLRVAAEFEMATDRPARVAAVRLRLTVPEALPDRRRAGLLAVASHCTVHNSLHQPPDIDMNLA